MGDNPLHLSLGARRSSSAWRHIQLHSRPGDWQQFDGTERSGGSPSPLGRANKPRHWHPLAANLGHFLAANNSDPEVQKIWPKNNIYLCAAH